MKKKDLIFIPIGIIMILVVSLAHSVGLWKNYSKPKYFSESEEISMSFEEVSDPRPNREYYRLIIHSYVTKREGFPFVVTEEVNTDEKGIYSRKSK